jgi:hypothetical protein
VFGRHYVHDHPALEYARQAALNRYSSRFHVSILSGRP